jgi:hypothetical protein
MSAEIIKPTRNKPLPKASVKPWMKPAVSVLKISRDTFSGSVTGFEAAGKAGLPAKR